MISLKYFTQLGSSPSAWIERLSRNLFARFSSTIVIHTNEGNFISSKYDLACSERIIPSFIYKYMGDIDLTEFLEYENCTLLYQIPKECIIKYYQLMPSSAFSNLRNAVEFGLTSWTPFESSDVHFACAAITEPNAQIINVEIRILPKRKLEEYVRLNGLENLTPDTLILGEDPRWEVEVFSEKRRIMMRKSFINYALLILALCGLLLSTTVAAVRQSDFVQRLHEAEQHELQSRQLESGLRTRLEQLRSASDALVKDRGRYQSVTQALESIASSLPESSLMSEFNTEESCRGKYLSSRYGDSDKNHDFRGIITILSKRPVSSFDNVIEFVVVR